MEGIFFLPFLLRSATGGRRGRWLFNEKQWPWLERPAKRRADATNRPMNHAPLSSPSNQERTILGTFFPHSRNMSTHTDTRKRKKKILQCRLVVEDLPFPIRSVEEKTRACEIPCRDIPRNSSFNKQTS